MTELTKPKSNRGWRMARHIFIALAVIATLVAIFYTEEDWRGKRAWESCKRELEEQGIAFDWNKFMPPNAPDDQNFYTANTNILPKFKQLTGTNDPNYRVALANNWLRLQITSSNMYPTIRPPVVANITVLSGVPVNIGHDTNTLLVNLDDPAAAGRARDLIEAVIGPNVEGSAGPQFYRNDLKEIRPAQIYVVAAIPPSDSALGRLIPPDTRLVFAHVAGHNSFDVAIKGERVLVSAADYLKWSDQFIPAFNVIREALKRPYAIIPGDYSDPAFMPIPNFVVMRALAQTLAQRAQCHLSLGEPDKALEELTLIHNVCRILENPPAGHPEPLVSSMINVAIIGLYVNVIAEGLQRHAWQEPQLIAIQEQLKETDLFPFVLESLRERPAHISRIAEMAILPELGQSRLSKIYLWSTPRGWVYQMMAVTAKLESKTLTDVDLGNNTISPKKLEETMRDINASINSHSPFYLLARIAIPNWNKAWQTTGYNQTQVNEAQIVCALERYRLAHGEYPETLGALVPQYIEAVPHDIIGGEPLHYRRTKDGKFLLYSVGWNETDDGGQESPHTKSGYMTDYSKGDWVWKN